MDKPIETRAEKIPALELEETLSEKYLVQYLDFLRVMYAVKQEMAHPYTELHMPNGTGYNPFPWLGEGTSGHHARLAASMCDRYEAQGECAFVDVLAKEFFAAMALEDESKLRAALIRVAAVTVWWVEALDRKKEQAEIERTKTDVAAASAESRRVARDDRLRALGFEEPSDEQRREQLALNIALRDWPTE